MASAFSLDDYLIESDWMNGGAFQKNEANDALAFPIDLPADGAFHEIVIDTSSHAGFAGSIHGLALVPFSGSPGELAIDYLRAGDGASSGATPDPKDRAGDPADCTCGVAAHDVAPWAPLASGLAALGAVFLRRRASPKGKRAC